MDCFQMAVLSIFIESLKMATGKCHFKILKTFFTEMKIETKVTYSVQKVIANFT